MRSSKVECAPLLDSSSKDWVRRAVQIITSGVALTVMALGTMACAHATVKATPAAQDDAAFRPFQPPISISDDPSEDAVVRIVGRVSCSGTLIGDDLVLTAHHCVSKRGAHGKVMQEDVDADSLRVELGGGDFPYAEVRVKNIVAPECGYAQGDGDLAILVLSRKLVGMPTWEPRIDIAPRQGDSVDAMGFGRCAMNANAIHRENRAAGFIESVSAGQFTAEAAICPGDSGGPVFDRTTTHRQVVGVVSASVMDTNAATLGASYFTRLDSWRPLFIAAREIANGADPNELPPFKSCQLPAETDKPKARSVPGSD